VYLRVESATREVERASAPLEQDSQPRSKRVCSARVPESGSTEQNCVRRPNIYLDRCLVSNNLDGPTERPLIIQTPRMT